jgi:hypothetical protein
MAVFENLKTHFHLTWWGLPSHLAGACRPCDVEAEQQEAGKAGGTADGTFMDLSSAGTSAFLVGTGSAGTPVQVRERAAAAMTR